MEKKAKNMGVKIISGFLIFVLLFTTESIPAGKVHAAGSFSGSDVQSKLDTLMRQMPAGASWTQNFAGGSQCYAFAHYVFNTIFNRGNAQVGNGAVSSNSTCYRLNNVASDITVVGSLAPGYSSASLEQLLESARPGDYIQVKRNSSNNPHSMIVTNVDAAGNKIGIFDANAVASNTVGQYTQTFSYFKQRNAGVTIYRYKYYQVVAYHNPMGVIDSVEGRTGKVYVRGWAIDEDMFSQPLIIHVYIGGPAGSSAKGVAIKADQERPDVDNIHKCGKYHGFSAEIPTDKTGRQDVYIYALDAGGGENILLGVRTVTIQKREYQILLRTWLSESKMGKEATTFKKGTMYYLCYEIIDSDTGTYTKDLDNKDYTVTETIYKPDGSAGHTCTYHNTNNWISLRFDNEGVYKGKVKFTINGNSSESITEGTVKHIHQYKSEVTESATCTSTGVRTYKCACGARYTEIIQKKEHIVVKDAAKSATCTQTGKTEGSHCAVCGTVMKRQQTVPKTGHKWDAGKISVQATSTTDGVKIFTCTSCGASKTEKIAATGQIQNPAENTEPDNSQGGTSGATNPENTGTLPTNPGNNSGVDGTGTSSTDSDNMPGTMPDYSQEDTEPEGDIPETGDIIRDVSETAEYEVISVEGGVICVEYNESTNSQAAVIRIPDTVETEDGTVCRVTSIAPGAFRNNKNIKKIYIGNYVETIGANAFYKCKNLTTITIGKNVTVIGSNAFSGCGKLTSLTLPSKVKKIGSNAFYGCKSLKKMNIQTTRLTSKGLGKKAFKGVPEKTTVQVPANKLRAYKKLFYRKGLSGKVRMK